MKSVLLLLCLAFPLSASAYCSLSLGASHVTVKVPSAPRIEARILNGLSDVVSGTYSQKNTSTAPEVDLDCTVLRTKGWGTFLAKVGLVEEFTDKVHTEGEITYAGRRETFTVDRIVRARGYLALALWEAEVFERIHGSLGAGGMYTKATADIHPLGSEFSLHAERSAWIPVVEGNVRWRFNKRSSVVGNARLYGHPTRKDRQAVGYGLYWRYSFD